MKIFGLAHRNATVGRVAPTNFFYSKSFFGLCIELLMSGAQKIMLHPYHRVGWLFGGAIYVELWVDYKLCFVLHCHRFYFLPGRSTRKCHNLYRNINTVYLLTFNKNVHYILVQSGFPSAALLGTKPLPQVGVAPFPPHGTNMPSFLSRRGFSNPTTLLEDFCIRNFFSSTVIWYTTPN